MGPMCLYTSMGVCLYACLNYGLTMVTVSNARAKDVFVKAMEDTNKQWWQMQFELECWNAEPKERAEWSFLHE